MGANRTLTWLEWVAIIGPRVPSMSYLFTDEVESLLERGYVDVRIGTSVYRLNLTVEEVK